MLLQHVLRGAAGFLVRVSRNEVIVAIYCSFDAPCSCHSPLRRVKSMKLILEARSFKKNRFVSSMFGYKNVRSTLKKSPFSVEDASSSSLRVSR